MSSEHRQKMVEAVKLTLLQTEPQNIQTLSEAVVATVLSFPLDHIHYAKDEKPQPRITGSHKLGMLLNDSFKSTERTDGYKAR